MVAGLHQLALFVVILGVRLGVLDQRSISSLLSPEEAVIWIDCSLAVPCPWPIRSRCRWLDVESNFDLGTPGGWRNAHEFKAPKVLLLAAISRSPAARGSTPPAGCPWLLKKFGSCGSGWWCSFRSAWS